MRTPTKDLMGLC